MAEPAPPPAEPAVWQVALRGLCPQCGAATLFDGLLAFRPRCPACGLDRTAFNVGDGAAAILILILGSLVTGLAIWLQLALAPPWWVQPLIWIPVATAATIASLRAAKAAMLALEYRHRAGEGRLK